MAAAPRTDSLTKTKFFQALTTPNSSALDLVRELLEQTPSLARERLADAKKRTALMVAAKHGFTQAVQILLPHSDPLARDWLQKTALMLATQHDNVETLRALLPHSDALAVDDSGYNALSHASMHRVADAIELLIPFGGARHATSTRETPLMMAAGNGDLKSIELLLPHSEAAAQNDTGLNALMISLARGSEACVEALLACTPLEMQDAQGRTVLHHAAQNARAPLVKRILHLLGPRAPGIVALGAPKSVNVAALAVYFCERHSPTAKYEGGATIDALVPYLSMDQCVFVRRHMAVCAAFKETPFEEQLALYTPQLYARFEREALRTVETANATAPLLPGPGSPPLLEASAGRAIADQPGSAAEAAAAMLLPDAASPLPRASRRRL